MQRGKKTFNPPPVCSPWPPFPAVSTTRWPGAPKAESAKALLAKGLPHSQVHQDSAGTGLVYDEANEVGAAADAFLTLPFSSKKMEVTSETSEDPSKEMIFGRSPLVVVFSEKLMELMDEQCVWDLLIDDVNKINRDK